MIYFKQIFENYEEFKNIFGISEYESGKTRRNKILLSLLKNRALLHACASAPEFWHGMYAYGTDNRGNGAVANRWGCRRRLPLGTDWLSIDSMPLLRSVCMDALRMNAPQYRWNVHIDGLLDAGSDTYRLDGFKGICEDGDTASIRYVNVERNRVFKMRAGKFLRKIIEENTEFDALLSEQVKIWLCEQFAEDWKAYAAEKATQEYELVVDDDFESIYSSDCCKGDFGSCMTDDGNHTFYEDAVSARAASLRDEDGLIVARCVIYDDVMDEHGNSLRLAERQYATDKDETLKRMLVMRLIQAGEIDGYKRVGAGYADTKDWLACDGNPLPGASHLHIRCSLEDEDTLSYQDSFKWYDEDEGYAYNWDCAPGHLDVTSGHYESEARVYSEFYDERIPEDDAVFVETRDTYFYIEDTVEAYVRGRNGSYYTERCYDGDCIEIGDSYYYAGSDAEYPEEFGICRCPHCDEWFVPSEDSYYSELTEEDYCCEDCMNEAEEQYHRDNGEAYAEWDEEWYDEDDVITALWWFCGRYRSQIISVDCFNSLVEDGEATEFLGKYYIDTINFEGEPVHACAETVAA